MRVSMIICLFVLMVSIGNAGFAQSRSEPSPAEVSGTHHTVTQRQSDKAPDTIKENPALNMLSRIEQEKESFARKNTSMREILIFADDRDRLDILDLLEAQELQILKTYALNALEGVLIITQGDPSTLQQLQNLLPDAQVDWNDDLSASRGPRLYAKDKIKWPTHGACLESAIKIPIGLIDGSIDQSHPAFAGQTIFEQSFLGDAQADQSHATAIASILIGNAAREGYDGLLKGAKLFNAVALRRSPEDQQRASVEATLRGLDWVMRKDVRLINVSLAGKKNRVLIKGFEKSLERGSLIFAAAGNNGPGAPPVYPAAIEGVFAVTAVDAAGRPYKAANTGDYIDFAAPGVDVWAANAGTSSGGYKSGTSYASVYGLGVASLILSSNKAVSKDVLDKAISAHSNSTGVLQAFCQM